MGTGNTMNQRVLDIDAFGKIVKLNLLFNDAIFIFILDLCLPDDCEKQHPSFINK